MGRFIRMAPIPEKPPQDRRIHYCVKFQERRFFCICDKHGCRHFHPDERPGDGSCSFILRKEKVLAKIEKAKAEEQKEEGE